MYRVRVSLLVCGLIFASSSFAQVPALSPSAPIDAPVRDPQAVAAVQNAINALGGTTVIAQQQSWVVQGDVTGNAGSSIPGGTFSWEAAGPEFRFSGSNSAGKSLFVTGHGKPTYISAGKSQALPQHMARAMFVPVLTGPVLLQELQNQSYSIRYVGTNTIGTESVVTVTTAAETTYPDNVVTPQTWYFDASTSLPVRVDFRSPTPNYPSGHVTERFDYSDFRVVAGTAFPFQISFSVNGSGEALQKYSVSSISVNASVDASKFDVPVGGVL